METALKEPLTKEQLDRQHFESHIKANNMSKDSFSYRFAKIIEIGPDDDSKYQKELKIFEEMKDYAIKMNKYDSIRKIVEEGILALKNYRTALPDYCLEKVIEAETSLA